MRKAAGILFLTGFFMLMSAFILGLIHFRQLFRIILYISFVPLLTGWIVLRIYRNKKQTAIRLRFNPASNKKSWLFNNIIMAGAIICMIGLTLKIMHIPNMEYLAAFGLAITIAPLFLALSLSLNTKSSCMATMEKINISETELHQYTGAYFNGTLNETMNLWVENGKLKARLGSQSSFVLSAIRENVFNCIFPALVIEFDPVRGTLTLIQAGRYLPFMKK